MYATGTGFAGSLASSEGTEIEYASKTKESNLSMSTKAGKAMTSSEWRRRSNHMKRLSLDLPEAIDQVNEEIQEVGEDIDSLIDSISGYRASLRLDSKLRGFTPLQDDQYQQIKEEFEDLVKTKNEKSPKGKSKSPPKRKSPSSGNKKKSPQGKTSWKKRKLTENMNEDSDFEARDKEDGTPPRQLRHQSGASSPAQKQVKSQKQSPRRASALKISTHASRGKHSREGSPRSSASSLSKKIAAIPHTTTTAQSPKRFAGRFNSISPKAPSDLVKQVGSTQYSGSTGHASQAQAWAREPQDLALARLVSGGAELKKASNMHLAEDPVHTPMASSVERSPPKPPMGQSGSKKNMMF